jgi:hypothetical protein
MQDIQADNEDTPKGIIEISDVPVNGARVQANGTDFIIQAGKRAYQLRASNPNEAKVWIEAVNAWASYLHNK